MKEIYEMKGAGRSIGGIAGDLGIARKTVRRYLNSPEALLPKPRTRRASNPSTSSGGSLYGIRGPPPGPGSGKLGGAAPGAEGPGL